MFFAKIPLLQIVNPDWLTDKLLIQTDWLTRAEKYRTQPTPSPNSNPNLIPNLSLSLTQTLTLTHIPNDQLLKKTLVKVRDSS